MYSQSSFDRNSLNPNVYASPEIVFRAPLYRIVRLPLAHKDSSLNFVIEELAGVDAIGDESWRKVALATESIGETLVHFLGMASMMLEYRERMIKHLESKE